MTIVDTPSVTGAGVHRATRRVRIGRREVGSDRDVYVIAEAGVNHNGDVEVALRMVDAAAEAGVNAVKFQMFRAEALTTATVSSADYQKERTGAVTQRDMLAGLELSEGSFRRIAARCADHRVDFIATPFSAVEVEGVEVAGGAAIKIASTDIVDTALLDRACASGLPIILSTGAADAREIGRAVSRLEARGGRERLVLMHCVSAYPTCLGDANLRAIRLLGDWLEVPIGFSDHTTHRVTGALAVASGACVLEKHFTLDTRGAGPDHAMSLEPAALTEYTRSAREARVAMGDGAIDCQEIERVVRAVGRKVVVAACDISSGARITLGMLTTKRAGAGLSPSSIDSLVGRRARRAIPFDTAILKDQIV